MRYSPVKRPVFPTVPLQYAKDQCEALSEGEIGLLIPYFSVKIKPTMYNQRMYELKPYNDTLTS